MGLWVLLVVGGSGFVGFVDKPFGKKTKMALQTVGGRKGPKWSLFKCH